MYDLTLDQLVQLFGSYGYTLFNLIRGIDEREVETDKIRKSISVEDTFIKDIVDKNSCELKLKLLYKKLLERCVASNIKTIHIKEIFLKIKFNDFEIITRHKKSDNLDLNQFLNLFSENITNITKPIRLLGLGFKIKEIFKDTSQFDIFDR